VQVNAKFVSWNGIDRPQSSATRESSRLPSETEERWFSIGWASNGAILSIVYLWSELDPEDDEMPAEIDFGNGVRGLHHIPSGAKIFLPTSIERSVWEYFSRRAEQKGIGLPELLTDILKRDIEINEALK
jgi:hypothetical protein